jgi:IS30 family transposase
MVANRERLGDWEVDTILGRRHPQPQQAIVSQTHQNSQAVQDVILRLLPLLARPGCTLTPEHGKEFAYQQQLADWQRLQHYFAYLHAV